MLKYICLLLSCFSVVSLTSQSIVVQPYLQDATTTSMTIMWEVDNATDGFVDWGATPFDLIQATASTTIVGNGNSKIHTARIDNLSPATKYYYRVRLTSGAQTLVHHFKTLASTENNESTQFIALSDMQRDNAEPDKFREMVEEGLAPVILSEVSADFNDLEGILIPGDLVVTGGTYSQWANHFFGPVDSLGKYIPIYPVPGNHEYHGGGLPNFLKYFTLPENGPAAVPEEAWYKDFSNVRVIGLNSNSGVGDQNAQLTWLQNTLDDVCGNEHIDFVFAQLHHPHKSELWTPGESNFTGEVVGRLEAFTDACRKASVHFFGHTHGYSRGQSLDHKHLWVNVAAAGGAIDYWGTFPNADYDEFSFSQDEYGFMLVEVEAGYDPSFKLKRYSRGDVNNIKNNVLVDSIRLSNRNEQPQRPVAIFPNGDTINAGCLVLKGSDFDTSRYFHQATHWQVARAGNFVDSLVYDEWQQHENWYQEHNSQAGDDLTDEKIAGLMSGINYQWRVRYRDEALNWSEWSDSKTLHIEGGETITENLVQNNGAENGVANWSGDIESLAAFDCGSVAVFEGDHMFAVGGVCANEQEHGLAFQRVGVSEFETDIDANQISAFWGGHMRDFSGSDRPEIFLAFYDDQGVVIDSTEKITNATTEWLQKMSTSEVPPSTREIRVLLKGTRNAGTDNDSYFDEIFLYLVERANCGTCVGDGADVDGDGFCADIDCFDNDEDRYPGALEICDGLDNNCDGLADSGATVAWSGNGSGEDWAIDENWGQSFAPLACQMVEIQLMDTVLLDHFVTIKGMTVGPDAVLIIGPQAQLKINAASADALTIEGQIVNNGQIVIEDSTGRELVILQDGMLDNQSVIDLRR